VIVKILDSVRFRKLTGSQRCLMHGAETKKTRT